jgi:hypothetical protein
MTAGTHTQYFIVIHSGRREGRPLRRRYLMTGLTHIRGVNVIGSFARADAAIMTCHTPAGDFVMIQRRDKGQPCCRGNIMADIAIVAGRWMRGWFAFTQGTVVASHATAQHLIVIHWSDKGQPGAGRRR